MENQKLWLLQRISPTEGPPIVIKEGLYKIGRSIDSNILCKSEWVSRFHCDLIVRDGFVYVRDLKSLNGTYILEAQVMIDRDVELKNGDYISLGKPYLRGSALGDQDHYVYKLMECCDAQEKPVSRKRKASSNTTQEVVNKGNNTTSPKRRKSAPIEKCTNEKEANEGSGVQQVANRRVSTEQGADYNHDLNVLVPPPTPHGSALTSADTGVIFVDLTNDDISDDSVKPAIQENEPRAIMNTIPGSRPDANDYPEVKNITPADFDTGLENQEAGKLFKTFMKIIKNKEGEKVLKTIEKLVDKQENGVEESPSRSPDSNSNADSVAESRAIINCVDSSSHRVVNAIGELYSLLSRSEANCNEKVSSTSAASTDYKCGSSDQKALPDSQELLTRGKSSTEQSTTVEACPSNIPDVLQLADKQIQCVEDDPSKFHIEDNCATSESICTKKIPQTPYDLSDSETNKKANFKYELAAPENIFNIKDNNSTLKPNNNEADNSSSLQNIVRNSEVTGNTFNEESLHQKENNQRGTDTNAIPENTDSADENSSSALLPDKKKVVSILNLKQEVLSDVEEEMAFSQDIDGVVVIELSEDELEYSQLFMEQDEIEVTDEKPNPTANKEEFFYENADDNEDIDLFQSHFSQCSQEQEVASKAETSRKRMSRSPSFEEEASNNGKQLTDEKMYLKRKNDFQFQDVRITLKRLEVESCVSSRATNDLEQTFNEPSVSDEVSCRVQSSHPLKKSNDTKLESVSKPHKAESLFNSTNLVESNKEAIDSSSIEKFEPTNEFINLKESKLAVSRILSDSRSIADKESAPEPQKTPVHSDKSKHRSKRKSSLSKCDSKKSESEKVEFNSTHLKQDEFKIPKLNLVNSYEIMNKESIVPNQVKEIQSNKELVSQIELNSKKDSFNSYRIKRMESSKKKDIAEGKVKLPPPDSICGAKLVKSTLLSQPPGLKRRVGRPRKEETSVTKEALKKKSQKEIVENRKVILRSLALKAKSETNDTKQKGESQTNIKEKAANTSTKQNGISINQSKDITCSDISEKVNDSKDPNITKSTTGVVKITERSRSTILLEGLLEAPNSRKKRGKKKVGEADSTRPEGAVIDSTASSNSCNEVSAKKEQAPEPELQFGVRISCLKNLKNKSTPNKKVTFNPNVKIKLFECQGTFRPVNAMGFKDKAPSTPLPTTVGFPSTEAVVTTLEETFYDVVHWNAAWTNEVKTLQGEPPVYAEKYNSKDSYISYKDYKRWLYPLIMYELWGNMCKTMEDEDMNKKSRVFDGIVLECLQYGIHRTNGKNLLMLKCFFPLYGKQIQNIVDPMDILLIRAQSASDGKRIVFIQFGLVYTAVKMVSYRETSDPIARHYLTTLNKKPDVCVYFDIIIYKSPSKPMSSGYLLRIRPTYNMMTELRQFESLITLAKSPLSYIIVDPVKNCSPVYLQKDLNNKIVTEYPLNEEQQKAILCTTQSVFANKPSISLIHGPPGTGKTQVIVAIVEQLLNRFKSKKTNKKKKILLCSQSNAAIDEMCLRLLDVRKQLPREKRFKLTRFGRKEKIHPKVLEIQTATLARKEIEKRNINEDFTLELSLHKATERMVATALEDSNSPNYANYKRKYENVQKKIASLEAIVNNASNPAARSKEIERLIFDEEMKVIFHSDIIATTLGSCSQRKIIKAFSELSRGGDRREVGVCIIDEATQVTEADVLLPLVHDVKNFILVGDPQQLPPYIISQTAKKCGLGQSLFSRLYKVWSDIPAAPVYVLTAQHRMHPEIAQFPSKAFYGGQLTTPSFLAIKRPFKPYAVITHNLLQDSGETNVQEACLVIEIAERLILDPDMKGLSIGLIVPYQRQRLLILELFHDKKLSKQLTVQTIDSYQGQERDIILLSCVRTSGIGFLNDNQRLNVALTRAKKGMYIIANFASLQATDLWKELLTDARERNLHLDIGTSGKVDDIFQFFFERKTKKTRSSSS